ncbi:MAG: T9SS type A sorting domain-containing protein [Saprospiraceae bacterium]|nr:T9SS type A sorting domain-containing protein [Saprospiraceae bacterium]
MRSLIVFISIFFLITFHKASGQVYFNNHYKIGNSSTTPIDLIKWQDQFVVSFLNFNELGETQSGLAFIEPHENNLSLSIFDNIRIGFEGIFESNDTLHIFGKKFENGNSLLAHGFDLLTMNLAYMKEYSTFLDSSFPFAGTEFNKNMYRSYVDDVDGDLHREFGIIKLDLNGDQLWQNNYSTHFAQNSIGGLEIIRGGKLIVGSNIQDGFLDIAQTLKINENGEVIDSVFSEEELLDFTSKVYLTVIDSQVIVNAYNVKRELDKQPIRIDYYNEDLELINHSLIPSTESMRINPRKIQKGRGDYLFMLGSFIDFNGDTTYGYLSKIGLNGEIIWEHYYQHPDYLGEDFIYSIVGICEEENGDIYCLGSIFPITSQQEVWLFKLNNNGCFGTDSCDQEVILSTANLAQSSERISVFPNPTSNILNIQSISEIIKLEVFDFQGMLVLAKENFNRNGKLNVSSLSKGIYAVKAYHRNGSVSSSVFVKD